jgi:hypothetical protein
MKMYNARERVATPVAVSDVIGAGIGMEMLHPGTADGLAGRLDGLSLWIGKGVGAVIVTVSEKGREGDV